METIHEKKNKFYIGANEDEPVGLLTYHLETERMIIEHVYVARELRGQGLGAKLVNKAVEYARKNHIKINSLCSYAESILIDNKEFSDIYSELND